MIELSAIIFGCLLATFTHFYIVKPWLDKKPAYDADGNPVYWYYGGLFGDTHAIHKDSTEDKCISVMDFIFGIMIIIMALPLAGFVFMLFGVIILTVLPIPVEILVPILLFLFIAVIARTIQILWQMSFTSRRWGSPSKTNKESNSFSKRSCSHRSESSCHVSFTSRR